MAEWISVKDRLPEKSDRNWNPYKDQVYTEEEMKLIDQEIPVLVFDGYNYIGIKSFFIEDPEPNLNRGSGFYEWDEYGEVEFEKINDIIKYWMPLPKPPKI